MNHNHKSGGALHLATIHGTEDDRVNCPYYFKIGACRHGDTCQRKHHKPAFSQTVLIHKIWFNPLIPIINSGGNPRQLDDRLMQLEFDHFYEELFEEMRKFGTVEEIQVLENLGDHMIGNAYVRFKDEDEAAAALNANNGRYYAGRMLKCEFSSVTDFRISRCRQFDSDRCQRESYCNFMHVHEPSRSLRTYLEQTYGYQGGKVRGTGDMASLGGRGWGGGGGGRGGRDRGRNDSRSRSRDRGRDRGRDRSRSRSRDRGRDRRGRRDDSRDRR